MKVKACGGPISGNREYGQPRDPLTAAARNLKSEYQDEYILGFDKQLNDAWTYGAKATFRNLRNAIDDIGDAYAIDAKMQAMGIDPSSYSVDDIQGSYLFNPGRTNVFMIPKADGSGYYEVPMTMQDFGFNTTMKRKYYGLNLYLEHPFDGKWYGIHERVLHLHGHRRQRRADRPDPCSASGWPAERPVLV